MMRPDCRRHGPWWHGDEQWPSRHRQLGMDPRARARFFRRIAFAAIAGLALAASLVAIAAWAIASRLGFAGWTAVVPSAFLLCAAVIGLFAMFGAMRRFSSPLGAVMDAADRVAEGDYGVRVPEAGPPPIRALAHSFNTMTERLQSADRIRRDLMADVAHELRTPLSVLQGRLEGLLDGVYARDDLQMSELLEETHVLSRLIEDLRTLALSDAGALPLQKESVDLGSLVHDVVRSMQPHAERKSISLQTHAPDEAVPVDLDPVRLREVLTNLLSNALRHTPPNAAVSVSMSSTNESATVTVSDSGEGMAADEVARMFDRFYKGSESRGSGLGLAIARGIVNAHGGEIRASSQRGKGTTVSFTLPRGVVR